jgi:hypothetical protein
MDTTQWFREHLQVSAEGLVWGAEQVPNSRRNLQPPKKLGEWTVARHVFHMLYYEQTIALPSMRQWLGEPLPPTDHLDEDKAWETRQSDSMENLLLEFRNVRADQIALLEKFDESVWNTTREAVWGPVTLLWVVSKTYQHTAEHTNDIMRIGLFWDRYVAREKEEAG